MRDLDEINRYVSALSNEEIQNLSDDEIVSLAMQRPGHPGVYGFMLSPQFFESIEQMSGTMQQLMQRLNKVPDLDEKMKLR